MNVYPAAIQVNSFFSGTQAFSSGLRSRPGSEVNMFKIKHVECSFRAEAEAFGSVAGIANAARPASGAA